MAKKQYESRITKAAQEFTSQSAETAPKTAENKTDDKNPAEEEKQPDKAKNKGGRPKKPLESSPIVVHIDKDILDEMSFVLPLYGGNRTKYINQLIRQDLETNKEKYDALKKIIG